MSISHPQRSIKRDAAATDVDFFFGFGALNAFHFEQKTVTVFHFCAQQGKSLAADARAAQVFSDSKVIEQGVFAVFRARKIGVGTERIGQKKKPTLKNEGQGS